MQSQAAASIFILSVYRKGEDEKRQTRSSAYTAGRGHDTWLTSLHQVLSALPLSPCLFPAPGTDSVGVATRSKLGTKF